MNNVPCIIIAILASFAIMALGVSGGIEKANKIMMPALFVLFVVLGVYIAFLPGAGAGYKYIFTLDPKGLLNPMVWIFAFGQAFFSLSVAGNGSVIYGSYLPKNENIVTSARNVAVFDTLAALLAAFVIIPAMAAGGAPLEKGGPGLMFVWLVNVLNGMPGGRIIGVIFFICVLFAGLSSIINLYEAPVATLQDNLKLKRVPATAIILAVGGIVAVFIQKITSEWMDVVSIYICPRERTLRSRRSTMASNPRSAAGSIRLPSMCTASSALSRWLQARHSAASADRPDPIKTRVSVLRYARFFLLYGKNPATMNPRMAKTV